MFDFFAYFSWTVPRFKSWQYLLDWLLDLEGTETEETGEGNYGDLKHTDQTLTIDPQPDRNYG